ncbi:MAG: hypothetical protein WAS33_04455 [Candidatus Promineifilaceae bacterium]
MKIQNLFLFLFISLFFIGCQSGPKLTPEELQAKWQSPLAISALNVGICQGVAETAESVQSGTSEGFSAFGELMGAAIMIQAVDEALTQAEPAADQTSLLSQMEADSAALKALVGPWINEEISSADVLDSIDEVCTDTEATFEDVVAAARKDGLSEEAAAAILEEMENSMNAPTEDSE